MCLQDDVPLSFARTQDNSPHGKLDDELPATRIEGEVKIGLMRIAQEEGISLGAVIATLCRARVLGVNHVAKVNHERLLRVVGLPVESRGPAVLREVTGG
jgi:hypothetical protein